MEFRSTFGMNSVADVLQNSVLDFNMDFGGDWNIHYVFESFVVNSLLLHLIEYWDEGGEKCSKYLMCFVV